MSEYQDGYVDREGVKLYYQIRGEGDPLLLLMGFGADHDAWTPHTDTYEKHFQCILPDNRGVGMSDAPEGPYNTAMMADDAIAILDHLGIDKFHVAGISMGGAIAQQVALRHSERVRSLALISTWARFNNYAKCVYDNLKKLRVTSDPRDFMQLLQLWIYASPYFDSNLKELKQGQKRYAADKQPQSQVGFEGQLDACIKHDVEDKLPAIDTPTLITVGEMDIFTPPAFSHVLHRKIKGARLIAFPEGGHVHHWEDLDRFNQVTLDFFKDY